MTDFRLRDGSKQKLVWKRNGQLRGLGKNTSVQIIGPRSGRRIKRRG